MTIRELQIASEQVDEGYCAIQQNQSKWCITIIKKKAKALSRMNKNQIREKILNSTLILQISKTIEIINWSLIPGDEYCGYRAMHAVSLHSEQKQYDEISKIMKIKSNPNPLAIFLQQQISKLNKPEMEESKRCSLRAIDNLRVRSTNPADCCCKKKSA